MNKYLVRMQCTKTKTFGIVYAETAEDAEIQARDIAHNVPYDDNGEETEDYFVEDAE
jgi:hypothetical protein